jgi:putative membrane protein insertion efficiency factor
MKSNDAKFASASETQPSPATNAGEARSETAAQRPPQVKMALLALRIYKGYFSPWLGGGCRFDPTCSVYMYQAIERFGVLRGVWFGLKRLARCQPFSKKFGYDPVPEKTEIPPLTNTTHPRASSPSNTSPKEAHL